MKLRKIVLFLFDVVLFVFAYFSMFFIFRVSAFTENFILLETKYKQFLMMLVSMIIMRLIFGIYKSIWRFADSREYIMLVISDFLACTTSFLLNSFFFRLALSSYFLFSTYMLSLLLSLSSRFIYRGLRTYSKQGSFINNKKFTYAAIIGAGYAGKCVLNELRVDKSDVIPYCFIDIDKSKIGSTINGVRVYGEPENFGEFLKRTPVSEIIIAIPSLSISKRNEIISKCTLAECKVKVYEYAHDKLDEKLDDEVKLRIRPIIIEDLLCRDEISFDTTKVRQNIADKVVLVTGGGGSIGSELCRQIASMRPKQLIILDIYENNAYLIQQELIRKYGQTLNLSVEIASVRDSDKLERIFNKYHPQLVFHAAAHKHVPLMEQCVDEAIKNNVFGTYNVVQMAEKYDSEKMLLISTDKAVNPTSVMGASKRICEMIIQSKKNSKTEYVAVRFGNVLGSNGSVIPLFSEQIKNGGPVTLTDKRITRYFMTIPEAVSLVLQTGTIAARSEIFVLDMGAPVKILDLAENLIKLSGFKPYHDIDIVEVGLRPGEKLYEELLIKTEEMDKTTNKKIFIERDKPVSSEEIEEYLNSFKHLIDECDYVGIKELLHKIIPTYVEPNIKNKVEVN